MNKLITKFTYILPRTYVRNIRLYNITTPHSGGLLKIYFEDGTWVRNLDFPYVISGINIIETAIRSLNLRYHKRYYDGERYPWKR